MEAVRQIIDSDLLEGIIPLPKSFRRKKIEIIAFIRDEWNAPLNFYALSTEQFDAEIQKGLDDLDAGMVVSSTQARSEIERLYGI